MGLRRIFARISETCHKNLCQFLCEYFLIKTVFASPPKKRHFFQIKGHWQPLLPDFQGFFLYFQGFCPNFQQIKHFGGALAPLPPTLLIAAVCCNSQVHVNMLTSSRFTSIQGKTISRISEFGVSFQHFRVSF